MPGSTAAGSPGVIQGLLGSLAPWLTGGSPSSLDDLQAQYGGQGLLGAELLANSGPPTTTAARLGRALLGAQQGALSQAAQRQQLAQGALGLQRAKMMMPLISSIFQQAGSGGAPASPNASTADSGAQPSSGSGSVQNGSQGASGASGGAPIVGPFSAIPQTTSAPGGAPSSAPLPVGAPVPQGDPAQQAYQRLLAQYRLGALLPMVGMNGSGFTKMADFQAANNPALVTRRAVAGNQLSQDQAQLYQAYASGNPMAFQAARMKYLTDSKLVNPSSWNNSLTLFGGLTPQALGYSAVNPQSGYQMIGGVASPIPNILPTRQALAGAQARGAAQGQIEEVTDAQGNKYYVPRSALLGGSGTRTAGSPTPGNGPLPFQASLGPSQESYLAGRGKESAAYVNTLQDGADAATNANYALDQMIADAQKVSIGPLAGAKEWMDKQGAALQQLFGTKNIKAPELSNYQALDKYANQIAFAATRQMGSREAAQIVHLQMQSNPNKELTPAAFADLAGSMKAMNNYLIAKNQVVQGAARQNGGDALAAAAQWTRTVDPRVWDLTLSPAMGQKWGTTIGPAKITAAYPYLTQAEQQALLRNLPASVLKELK